MFSSLISFEIVRKDSELKLLEVMYSAEGYEPTLVSMRFPPKGADLLDYFHKHAPISVWEASRLELEDLDVGFKGSFEPRPLTPDAPIFVEEPTPLSEEDIKGLLKSLRGETPPPETSA
jgi:hypothetical protein